MSIIAISLGLQTVALPAGKIRVVNPPPFSPHSMDMSNERRQVIKAVEDGCKTVTDISVELDATPRSINIHLKKLVEDGILARVLIGKKYSYFMAERFA